MTIHDRTSPVLVGVDGSASAIAATRWAAAEAARHHVPLHIVNVYTWPVSGYPEALIAGHDLLASMKNASAAILDEARAAAESVAPEVAVSVTSHGGDTVAYLRSLSKKSSLLSSAPVDSAGSAGCCWARSRSGSPHTPSARSSWCAGSRTRARSWSGSTDRR